MIETIIVDDNLYVQTHFSNLFEKDPRFHIAGIYRDAFEAEAVCRKSKIDLVLMDVQTLHNHSGLAAGKRIKEACPHTKVIVVTSLVDPDILTRARHGCADSLWYKDHGDDDIIKVIEKNTCRRSHISRIIPGSGDERCYVIKTDSAADRDSPALCTRYDL